jgi:hypothetical protein
VQLYRLEEQHDPSLTGVFAAICGYPPVNIIAHPINGYILAPGATIAVLFGARLPARTGTYSVATSFAFRYKSSDGKLHRQTVPHRVSVKIVPAQPRNSQCRD